MSHHPGHHHHHNKGHHEHQHHDQKNQQMGALRVALEHAGRSVQIAEAALEKTKAELLTERMRRAQMTEQCERALEALHALRAENKRLRTLVAERSAEAAASVPPPPMPSPIPVPPIPAPRLDDLNAIELCPTERVAPRR